MRKLSNNPATMTIGFFLFLASFTPVSFAHEDCGVCHLKNPPAGTSDLIRERPDLCIDCHPERSGNGEHKINIPPSAESKPNHLPLVNGLIGCVTCHDVHGSEKGLLRLPVNDLCAACHWQ